jgi:hypothetical protein
MSGPYAPVTQEKLDAATDKPLPAAQRLKTNIDDFLTGNVVEPLAQRGYPNLGAALATVPSVAAEMMIPSTTGELQAGVIPFPGAKLTKAAKDAIKVEGRGATIINSMKEKIGGKIQELRPTTSINKQSWFDDIGGSAGIKQNLDELAKLNSDDTKISRLTDQIKKFSKKASENKNADIRMNYEKQHDKAMDNLIDHINTNQSEIKLPPKKLDDLELFHGSKTGLSEIKEKHNPVGIDFGGIFASPSEVSAASHGNNLYRTKINKADVLDQQKINEIIDDKKIEDILKKSTRLDPKSSTFEEDLDLLKESVLQNKNIFDLDLFQEDKIKHLVRTEDLGEASWELQTIRGKIAKALGYKAVEMPDEHGMSYLVFPGNKIEKIER